MPTAQRWDTSADPPDLRITRDVLGAIARHAADAWPIECCGLVLGHERLASGIVRARNMLGSRTRFRIDPQDHFAALRRARASGLAVIGAYHSHPDGTSAPSRTDLAEAHDDLVHLIAGIAQPAAEPVIRAWQLDGGNFRPVALVPVP